MDGFYEINPLAANFVEHGKTTAIKLFLGNLDRNRC
ncbi:hypothetical protein ABENE_23220 [Asticcacaulis benevestitus DSM 16100 = ATCC BAA-896]|uniref:Uncharacterized protein n=1 Tax=Asticcacaulis benevestitus DSM 16100 = ATCC BAA-896 TaxID=1121022 RepID=V4QFF2_9CAUL|nr:hypothetical protein ABENE_23220 [Asticcacaulis benevestitus DSM 16100 = ATCC BAA-896]